jgi:cytochrome d ubiquinol oxidase subunit I
MIDPSLIEWSRAQFALTAMFHWIFVPLTLGLGVIMSVMETYYVRTGAPKWRRATRFWQKIFGINFAVGVATGIILEFEFGTNWSNYSWFVGDIFGAPLAIEGIFAFFMETTFIAVMFFAWEKVGKGFHLASTWLTTIGATLSALWILVANAWMQHPVGMAFNPETARNEMVDFWALISPFAVNKFFHTVLSGWMLGAAVVVGISAWFLLRKRETVFAKDSMKVGAAVGLIGILLTMFTGDRSAFLVAKHQPMKLAAMEGLYDGGHGVNLTAIGIINTGKKYDDKSKPMLWEIPVPKILSLLATHSLEGYVPGVNDIICGGYEAGGSVELPVGEKMKRGKLAISALREYRKAMKAGDSNAAATAKAELDANYRYFGYGYFNAPSDAVPNVPLVFYSFRIMVGLGIYFLFLFVLTWLAARKPYLERKRWLLWLNLASIPLAYVASQAGWIVAEVGRQPWAIQDTLPVFAAVSDIKVGAVQVTFFLFLFLFTLLFAADLRILLKQIKDGPEQHDVQ